MPYLRFIRFRMIAVVAFCAALWAGSRVEAQGYVDLDTFYDALAPHGVWFESSEYGWVWQPSGVGPDFRPYSRGHWVWTDDYGWYWASDYPWGWATFHYGRWYRDARYGWLWVPGSEWAPAWVAWRSGDGVTGWAPLPPSVRWRASVGLDFEGDDRSLGVEPEAWIFVEEPRLIAPRAYEVAYAPSYNRGFLVRTRNVTRYAHRPHGIYNAGVSRQRIEVVARAPVPRVRIVASPHRSAERSPHYARDTVHVYRPEVRTLSRRYEPARRSAPAAARPVSRVYVAPEAPRVHREVRHAPARPEHRERHEVRQSAPPRPEYRERHEVRQSAPRSEYRERHQVRQSAPRSEYRERHEAERYRPDPRRRPAHDADAKRLDRDRGEGRDRRSAPSADERHDSHRHHRE